MAPAQKRAKSGKKKDPNAPKKPLSAFFVFLNDKRDTYVKEHPSTKLTEVTKALAEVWKGLTEQQKKPYDEKAAADKSRYEKEMKNYTPPDEGSDDEPSKGKGKEKKKKDPNAPKRAMSAYMFFGGAVGPKIRAEHQGDHKEVMGKIAEAWKVADKATRDKYEKMAADDKKRYAKEIEAYKGKGKAAPAKDDEDEDESEEEEEEVAPAQKKKKVVTDDDDDEE